jgi:simple sugar transport system ATP-binding protein
VHQHFKLVRPFTVAENALLASPERAFRAGLRRMRAEIRRIADSLGFALDPDQRVDRLSVAEQQRAEIVKVMIGGADILILDEPTAVLTDEEATALLSTVRRLAAGGTTVILVTHKLAEVPAFTDTVTVMRGGRVVAEGASESLSADELTRLMVGSDLPPIRERAATTPRPVLALDDVAFVRADGTRAIDGLTLTMHAGEIYGVAGVGGNGQTELAGLLTGLLQPSAGTIRLFGADVTAEDTRHLRERGLAYVPAERMRHGLAEDLSVADNYAIAGLRRGRYGTVSVRRGAMKRDARAAIEASGIRGARPDLRAGLLSGGNAQKLLLARELSDDVSFLVAHSPTRGLDVRACAAVYDALLAARARGVAVLLVSEDLDEILAMADRIGVLNRGRIVGAFDAPADRHAVGRLMVGHA